MFRLRLLMVFLFFSLFLHARDYVSFCAVGDVLLDRGIRMSIEANGVDYPFTEVKKILKQFDITFGNLESPLVSKGLGHALNKRYCFRGEPEWVKILKDAGFDILSVANNHTIDWGREGFLETMENLKEAGIEPVGGGINQEKAFEPVFIEKNGVRIAFFGMVQFILDGIIFLEEKPGPAYMNVDRLCSGIRKVRNLVDVVVVSFHWGFENEHIPNRGQIEAAHMVINAGANLVIGHHPHVIQPLEWYKNGLIVYSLGNFLFDPHRENQKESMIFACTFRKGSIDSIRIIPVYIENNHPVIPDPEQSESIFRLVKDMSSPFGTDVIFKKKEKILIVKKNHIQGEIPVKTFVINKDTISVFSDRFEINGKCNHLQDSLYIIEDVSYARDNGIIYFYAVVRNKETGKRRIAVFPVDVNREELLRPLLDVHENLNPWKIRCGDLDGDGEEEVVVATWKKTRYFKNYDNRLFVYKRYNAVIYPAWLGSKIGDPFGDFELVRDNKGIKLILLQRNKKGERRVNLYRWNGFGFDFIRCADSTYKYNWLAPFIYHLRATEDDSMTSW